ncbi:MAG: hypothetical protein SAL07_13030 [Oscillatoria sp. PMC 1051.18]|nr:hypothetical protein [Oscillatoria salina]MBZ8180812.1 hypothetical protein [Oscillatoria salina IIICB1]MEC5030815.1 hypothetical protein [Oscillatoria sp. PMC 1051.18]NET88845.1 hypothetical protein [Kamptonema sp. SIO1D9]
MLKLAYKLNYQERRNCFNSKLIQLVKQVWLFSLYYGKFISTRPEQRNKI